MRILHLAVLFILAACTVLPEGQDAPRIFLLNAPRTPPANISQAPVNLEVALPQATPGLDSERVALRKSGQEMDYFAGARWAGPLPLVVQSQLVDVLDNAHVVRLVGSDTAHIHADAVLVADIRDFQAEYDGAGAPIIHVRLAARLVRVSDNTVLGAATYEEREPAVANTLDAVVMAYNVGFARAADRLAQDIGPTLSPAPAPRQESSLPELRFSGE